MKPLGLAARLSLAAALSSAVVLGLFAWGLHHSLQRAISDWDRANLGAIAHHASTMVAAVEPSRQAEETARLAQELASFGVVVELTGDGEVAEGRGVRVSLPASTRVLAVRSSRPASDSLGRRLAPLYFALAAVLLVVLLATLQASIYWGLVKPLRAVRRQLRAIERGPWRAPAAEGGPPEIAALARHIEAVGETLGERVTLWVEAERRAGAELARSRLRALTLPLAREVNLVTSDLLARGRLDRSQIRLVRRLRAVADHLTALYTLPLDDMVDVSLPPQTPSDDNESA